MRFFAFLTAVLALAAKGDPSCSNQVKNQCVQFTVGQGTGCAWMCSYCATQLGTNNYYFTDNVCSYQAGQGCVGSPVAGKAYTCCAASE